MITTLMAFGVISGALLSPNAASAATAPAVVDFDVSGNASPDANVDMFNALCSTSDYTTPKLAPVGATVQVLRTQHAPPGTDPLTCKAIGVVRYDNRERYGGYEVLVMLRLRDTVLGRTAPAVTRVMDVMSFHIPDDYPIMRLASATEGWNFDETEKFQIGRKGKLAIKPDGEIALLNEQGATSAWLVFAPMKTLRGVSEQKAEAEALKKAADSLEKSEKKLQDAGELPFAGHPALQR